ncbi:hypothetical protein KW841_09885 [Pseudomonas sp. PDM28]|uniref:DUF6124 family protein n=1 Tax=Pseudomonas sp. PDM28 TaxID=2854770 RepID=UPI001C438497|nr:hypothetical protein [Pseudomonas sp. PDM28]MBV7552654.1 hypothetical protein [Pseudomonas sp. PDM28]
MKKSVPDPPPETSTEDPLRDRSALYRAIDFHLTGKQPAPPDEMRFYNVSKDVSFEDTQLYVADLLRCASVTAFQCGDQLKGADRAMVYSIWHLLEIAKAMVDHSIECLGMKKG